MFKTISCQNPEGSACQYHNIEKEYNSTS